jgi:hypothetical protein
LKTRSLPRTRTNEEEEYPEELQKPNGDKAQSVLDEQSIPWSILKPGKTRNFIHGKTVPPCPKEERSMETRPEQTEETAT